MFPAARLTPPFKLTQKQIDDGYECNICQADLEKGELFTNHTNTTHNGWHVACITEWLKRNDVCPNRDAIITNSLESRARKVLNFIGKASQGTSLGFQYAFNEQVFGAFTAVTLGSIIAGSNYTRHILAILGTGCISAGLYGIYERFNGTELSAETNISLGVALASILGSAAALVMNLSDSKVAQAAGLFVILHNAGKYTMAKGALLGGISGGGALKSLGEQAANILPAAQVGGATGGITKVRSTWLPITYFSCLSGFAVAKVVANVFSGVKNPLARAILSGAIGGMFASSAATVLDNGYSSFKERGLAFLQRRGN